MQEEENGAICLKLKELQDERGRLHRTNASQQTQIDKYKKLSEDTRGKVDSLENQLSSTKKVSNLTCFDHCFKFMYSL